MQQNSLANGQTNFEIFRNILDDNIMLNIKLKAKEDLDNAIQHFITTIQESVTLASTKTNLNSNKYSHMKPLLFIKRNNSRKCSAKHNW